MFALVGEKQKSRGTVFTLNARVQVVTVGVNDRNKIGDGVTGAKAAKPRVFSGHPCGFRGPPGGRLGVKRTARQGLIPNVNVRGGPGVGA